MYSNLSKIWVVKCCKIVSLLLWCILGNDLGEFKVCDYDGWLEW